MGFLTIAKVRHPTHPNLYIGVGEIGELAHPKTPHFGEIGELPRQFFFGANKPGSPEKYKNGNRGKVKSRPSFGTKGAGYGHRHMQNMRL